MKRVDILLFNVTFRKTQTGIDNLVMEKIDKNG